MVPRAGPGISPKGRAGQRALSRSAIRAMADRRVTEVIAKCGCLCTPEEMLRIAKDIHCPAHGWQPIVRTAKLRDLAKHYDGFDIPFPEYSDEPPF
jgi:predicted RNA-binding Zn-ribbon protein involved in translation (DUF1610 family)